MIVFFVRVDSRLSALEDWKNEILPTRVTIKDIQIIEEKIRNIDSKVTDIKDMVKK